MALDEETLTDLSPETRQLAARVARRFYLDDRSKVQIATEFGISRFRVARLLDFARTTGIVRIDIVEPTTNLDEVASALRSHLNLEGVRVVDTSGSAEEVRSQLGAMTASYLSSTVRPGQMLGMSWGRTLAAMTTHLRSLPPVKIVQLSGTVGSDVSRSPVELIRRIMDLSSSEAFAIFAPFFLGSSAAEVKNQADIKSVIEMYPDVDLAVLGVGSWEPLDSELYPVFPQHVRQQLDAQHARGEIVGIFVNDDGEIVFPELIDQCIAVTPYRLLRTPRVVAVAAGPSKTAALYAVARSGLITEIITDKRTATAMLDMPAITSHALQRYAR